MTLIEKLKSGLERIEATGLAELHSLQADAMTFIDHMNQHLLQYPEPVFAVLRRVKPVLLMKNVALVTRYQDVLEVLARDDVFQVTYGEKMRIVTGGQDFFLGMQNSPQYERDTAHMRTVMRREDLGAIVSFVAKTAEELVSASGGQLDVVRQLSSIVPARWIASYFGCVPPSDQELADWGTAIFQYLFTDLKNDPAVGQIARDAAVKTRAWLDDTIVKRKAQPSQVDDVLARCLKLQGIGVPGMDDLGIRNNLIGLLVGAIPTTSKCCAQALDELLKRPAELEKAQQAARADDNDALFAQYVFEALRFNPNNPGLFRIAAQEYTLGKGTLHATSIPKGASVVAATQSAMFDDRIVDSPNDFKIGRPGYIYIHWGSGMHTCFGQYVNQVQIPGILKPLLKRKGLRRAGGDAGKLQYTGPFPSNLGVEFEA